jgi:hypothetical protein
VGLVALQWALTGLCLLAAGWITVLLVRDRGPGDRLTLLLGVVEIGLVAQLVLGILRVTGPHRGVSVPTYVGYLVGSLVILPVAWLWSASERSRGGTAVLLVAVLLVPFLFLRLAQVWSAHG